MPQPVCWYLIIIGGIGLLLTAYDKWAAKSRPAGRIPERTLLMLAVLGGAAPMYVLMLLIRHKTRHKLFMIGLPLIILIQAGVLIWFSLRVFA